MIGRHLVLAALVAVLMTNMASMSQAHAADSTGLSAVETLDALAKGQITSEALTKATLEALQSRPDLNAITVFDADRALAAARSIDARRAAGQPLGALAGLPIVVKDNIHLAGLPNTAGTPALKNFVPDTNAPVVQKLIEAGAVVIAKTNMHELAFGISGYNTAFQTAAEPGVRNAYDGTRFAGGSSSGTGAVVGARLIAAGLGSDTGGSVRIPCAVNGCVGLRPTVGRYPGEGITPISHTRDTAGPMARTAADVELLDRVVTGAAPQGPADPTTIRLGVAEPFLAGLDADTKAAFDAALDKLRARGFAIVPVEMTDLMELNSRVSFPVALYEAYDDLKAYLARYVPGLTVEAVAAEISSPDVKGTYMGLVLPRKLPGPNNTVVDALPAYQEALTKWRLALQALYAETFSKNRIDALVFPTVPRVAITADPESSSLANFLEFIRNTDPGSNAGIPGITVPIGLGATSRVPIGLELDGPAGSDRQLIAIAQAVETTLGPLPPPSR
jgi:indoleacetamide hydrolase